MYALLATQGHGHLLHLHRYLLFVSTVLQGHFLQIWELLRHQRAFFVHLVAIPTLEHSTVIHATLAHGPRQLVPH